MPLRTETRLPTALPLLAAACLAAPGCHLFASGRIDKTCEDVPRGCPGTVDTTHTGETAEPPFVLSLGWVEGRNREGTVQLVAFDGAANVLVDAEAGTGFTDPGPVAWDPDNSLFYLVDNGTGTLHVVPPDGTPTSVSLYTTAGDLLVLGGILYLATPNFLMAYDPRVGVPDTDVVNTTFGRLDSVFPYNPDIVEEVWLVDLVGDAQAPRAYHGVVDLVDPTASRAALAYDGYEPDGGRSGDGFMGPGDFGDFAYVCNSAGAVFAINQLKTGVMAPAAMPSSTSVQEITGSVSQLSTVTDCAWDGEADAFLLFDATWGVFALSREDTDNLRLVSAAPSAPETAFRASFF